MGNTDNINLMVAAKGLDDLYKLKKNSSFTK